MLYLKLINENDIIEEHKAISNIPALENGFKNKYYGCSFNEFKNEILNTLINYAKGKDLPNGYVPCSYMFLWEDNTIVGLFKIRHFLNEKLKNGAGHLGFCVLKDFRRKGYATKGLKLAIDECKKIIKDQELYMSVLKDNVGSLKAQLNNGAKIVNENDDHFFTRIKL